MIFSKFSHYGGQKIGLNVSLTQKTHFQPFFNSKHVENTLKIMINLSMASKNLKNHPEIKKKSTRN
jgi:hypothetical protein